MAKLKPRALTSEPSRDPHDMDPLGGFAIESLLGDSRPGAADPEADGRWLAGRRFLHARADQRFDPRSVLGMTTPESMNWQAERIVWLTAAERSAWAS
jgi:hypothetical protein